MISGVNWSLFPQSFPFAIWGSDAQYIQECYDMGFGLCFGDGSPAKVAAVYLARHDTGNSCWGLMAIHRRLD